MVLAGKIYYTPGHNYNGADFFTYTLSDGRGGMAASEVTVSVTPAPEAPMARADTVVRRVPNGRAIRAFKILPSELLANDSDEDTAMEDMVITLGSMTTTEGGSLQIVRRPRSTTIEITYPAPGRLGGMSDSFVYAITDPTARTSSARVTLLYLP